MKKQAQLYKKYLDQIEEFNKPVQSVLDKLEKEYWEALKEFHKRHDQQLKQYEKLHPLQRFFSSEPSLGIFEIVSIDENYFSQRSFFECMILKPSQEGFMSWLVSEYETNSIGLKTAKKPVKSMSKS